MKMEQTECSETSAYKIQTAGNYPEESIQHTEQGESLKSRIHRVIYPSSKLVRIGEILFIHCSNVTLLISLRAALATMRI
jgi:hypothetical protein